MPRLSKIGAAALAAFGWTSGGGASIITASYLVVAGGGSGGSGGNSGGGGAGGFQTGSTSFNTSLSYTVTVGAGGASPGAVNSQGNNGSNSQIGTLTASVGGGGGGCASSTVNGKSGGSGGGAGGGGSSGTGGSGTSGQGNAGGNNAGTVGPNYTASGGGGASAAGGVGDNNTPGNGGAGTASSISGSSVTYAGGGGGATNASSGGGSGGSGGGGTGAAYNNIQATAGTANTGGGGGGGTNIISSTPSGGNGGSGVVIIAYPLPQQFGGGVITTDGTNCIHTFTTSGTLSPINSLSASYLIVAGGGAGNSASGGGGAGGMLTGSALTIDTNSTYLVTVGAGGTSGGAGTNSNFGLVSTTAIGGGGGGQNGGSGGGAGSTSGGTYAGGLGTAGQGNNGGANNPAAPYPAGGGGGAGAVGGTGSGNNSGNGGNGLSSSISGTATYYAGGGGAGIYQSPGVAGSGGLGGGGAGSSAVSGNGTSGTANTGGGGGGAGSYAGGGTGGAGGSGIVIISYAGTTQQMAGGTVTIVGGNVIHTFTTSGYLTPLTFVGNSLRFRNSAAAYLSRTPTTTGTGGGKTWTYSCWAKIDVAGNYNWLLIGGLIGSSADCALYIDSVGQMKLNDRPSGAYVNSTAVYRDPAAWYHFVFAVDTTQATAANRIKMYVNGVQTTAFSSTNYPSQNTVFNIGINQPQRICTRDDGNTSSMYLAETRFIDGQQLPASAFGTFNSYGVWQPINYGGSYGTNGFYLPFSNKTSTTTLGYDFSPAGNNWTTNNISLTAGSTYDSMTDVPTLTSVTAANYATFNPLNNGFGVPTYSNGNLRTGATSTPGGVATSTIYYPLTGKFYTEFTVTAGGSMTIGLMNSPRTKTIEYVNNGNIISGGSTVITGSSFTTGDVLGMAVNCDGAAVTFYKNNVSQGTVNFSSAPLVLGDIVAQTQMSDSSEIWSVNFGQQPFTYTPPTGYVGLNTYNL